MIEFPGSANPARQDAPPPGSGTGYLARPEAPNGAGLLVLHAWWGLSEGFKRMADQLAAEGYLALAPDAYGTGDAAATIEQAQQRMDGIDMPRAEQVVLGAADWLANETGRPLATVGCSLGANFGLWLARKRPEQLAATVLYYGTGEPAEGRTPVLGHFAAHDAWQAAEEVDTLEAQLRETGRLVAFHRYEGADHWFAESDRPEFNPAAAELAWKRTLEFLRERLLG